MNDDMSIRERKREKRSVPCGKKEDPSCVVFWVIKLIDKSFSF